MTGDGPVVLLLHAGIADRRMWDPVVDALARTHRVVWYDLRGYGESRPLPASFAHHDDAVAVLDALGVDAAALVGCSFGGSVAVDTALAHPERVTALALFGSVVSGYRLTGMDELWERVIGDVDEDDLEVMALAEVRLWVVGPDRQRADVDPDLIALAEEMNRAALAGEAELDREEEAGRVTVRRLDPPASDRLGEVTVPTLVTVGEFEVPEVRRLADRIGREVPGAQRLPDLTGTAHLAPLERPGPVTVALLDFLPKA